MNPHFAEWYQAVSPNPSAERVERRWKTIAEIAESAGRDEILDLVRLTMGQAPSSQVKQKMVVAIKRHDAAFVDGAMEMSVIAGASLVAIIEQGDSEATLAALAVVAADWFGTREGDYPKFPIVEAKRYCSGMAERVRVESEYGKRIRSMRVSRDAIEQSFSTAGGAEVEKLFKWTREVADTTSAFMSETESRLIQLREEHDILWWLLGAYSRDLNIPWKDFPKVARALLLAKELSDLVRRLPGPMGAAGVMERALDAQKKSKNGVIDSVLGSPNDWRIRCVSENRAAIHDICPVSAIISFSSQPERDAEAVRLWATGTYGKNATNDHSHLAIAEQFYNELLLGRAWDAASSKTERT